MENGTIVGQFPAVGEQERFGMVFEKGSPLVGCVDAALQRLKDDGRLEEIQQSLIRELVEGGMTMLIATHEMSFARDIADRVCFLDDGVILEEGPPDRIFTAPAEPRTQQFLQRIIEAGRL